MNKGELRKIYLKKRESLSDAEYFQLNRQICESFFFSIDLSFVKVLHTFLPITSKKEVDTWLIIDRIRREFPHVRISIPRVNDQSGELENFYFEGLHQLQQNNWGILEPKQGIPTEVEKIDLVLVPLLAFDKTGHRVGYGKGFYDRLLSRTKESCMHVGLSLFEVEDNISDATNFDHPLTRVITSKNIYEFK